MNQIRRPRILFVAEAVTLAQVVRLAALARSLPAARYQVEFASAIRDPLVFGDAPFRLWPLRSISPERAERALALGLRLYDRGTLDGYLQDDLRLIDEVRPDLIVSDLRWSLAVSGPLRSVPVIALANAYWSPLARRAEYPLPDHPLVRLLGVRRAARHFPFARPYVFRHFARPLDELRERNGLEPLGSLEAVLTWGDVTLFADPPSLVPLASLPAAQRFLGPVQWAPDAPGPPEDLGKDRPLVYVTLGSSGNLRALPAVLEGLSDLDCDVLLATAGRALPRLPANARAVPFVRGDLAARRASVVVSNGGSSTGYQALAEGTPVVGVPWNLDQYLATEAIVRAGAGLSVRSGTATAAEVREAVGRAIGDADLREGARRVAAEMAGLDAPARFCEVLDEVLR